MARGFTRSGSTKWVLQSLISFPSLMYISFISSGHFLLLVPLLSAHHCNMNEALLLQHGAASVNVLCRRLGARLILVAVMSSISSEGVDDLLAVLLGLLAGVFMRVMLEIGLPRGRNNAHMRHMVNVLGLERLALWPCTLWEISSFPCVSSSMSRETVDLAPAESMLMMLMFVGSTVTLR